MLRRCLGSVQHDLSQLTFSEGSDEIVSGCCVVWDSDSDIPCVRKGNKSSYFETAQFSGSSDPSRLQRLVVPEAPFSSWVTI